jgi:hypothetical protein
VRAVVARLLEIHVHRQVASATILAFGRRFRVATVEHPEPPEVD